MDSYSSIVLVAILLSIDLVVFEVTTEVRHSFGLIVSTSTYLATAALLPYHSKSNVNERVILVIELVRQAASPTKYGSDPRGDLLNKPSSISFRFVLFTCSDRYTACPPSRTLCSRQLILSSQSLLDSRVTSRDV